MSELKITLPQDPHGTPQGGVLNYEFGDLFRTALSQFNTFAANPYEGIRNVGWETDPNFDPYDQPEIRQNPPLGLRLGRTRSRGEFDATYSQIQREEQGRRSLEAGGVAGLAASSLAYALDPFTLGSIITGMPIARTGRMALGGAFGAAQTMAQTQRSDVSASDWALNVGLGALGNYFGGPLLGGMDNPSVAALTKRGAAIYSEDVLSPAAAEFLEKTLHTRATMSLGEITPGQAARQQYDNAKVFIEANFGDIKSTGLNITADDLAGYATGQTKFWDEGGVLRSPLASGAGGGIDSVNDAFKWLQEQIRFPDENRLKLQVVQTKQQIMSMFEGESDLQRTAMARALNAIPDVYYRNIALSLTDIIGEAPGPAGLYVPSNGPAHNAFQDLIMLARRDPERGYIGGTFSHEIGHRVAHRFLDAEELERAYSLWRTAGSRDPGWGNAFQEWFAEEFRKAAKRVADGTVGHTKWLDEAKNLDRLASSEEGLARFQLAAQAAIYRAVDTVVSVARSLGMNVTPDVRAKAFFDDLMKNPRQMQDGLYYERLSKDHLDKFFPDELRGYGQYDRMSVHAMQAAAGDNRLAPTGIAIEKIAINPLLRLGNSPIGVIRDFAQKAFDYGGMFVRDNLEGGKSPVPVEVAMKVNHLPRYVDALMGHRDAYHQYRQRLAGYQAAPGSFTPFTALKQFASDMVRGRGGAMGPNEFDEIVGRSLHGLPSDVPEVAQAAAHWRKFYDDTWAAGQNADVWTRDLRTQKQKLFQNIEKNLAEHDELLAGGNLNAFTFDRRFVPDVQSSLLRQRVETLHTQLEAQRAAQTQPSTGRNAQLEKRIDWAKESLKAIDDIEAEIASMRGLSSPPKPVNADGYFPLWPRSDLNDVEKVELENLFFSHMSRGITDQQTLAEIRSQSKDMVSRWVRELPFNRFTEDTVGMARSMHQRDLPIPVEQLVPFIETNVELVSRAYMRRVGAEIELSKAFDGKDLAELVNDLTTRGKATVAAMPQHLQGEANRVLDKNIKDVRASWERIVGIYGMPDSAQDITAQAVAAAKSFTYITTSGPHVLVSLPDLMRPVHVFGLKRAFGSVVKPMLENDWETLKMAAGEARLFGEATQTALGMFGLMSRDFGIDLAGSGFGKVARALNSTAHGVHLLNLMAPFEDISKRVATIVAGSDLMENILRATGRAEGEADMARLARHYLDTEMAERIAKQFSRAQAMGVGRRNGALIAPGTQVWDDEGAVAAWRAAMSGLVNHTIVTPGVGDTPLWMSTQVGSALAMYKRFGVASAQRVTMAGLQEGDRRFWMGSLAMLGAGAFSAWALGAAGHGRPWDRMDVADRLQAAVDRSGVTAYMSDLWGMWERLSSDKTSWPGFVGAVTGPIGTQATHAAMGAGQMLSGQFDGETFKHLSRLTPLGSVAFLRPQVDALAEGMLAN